jgi:hypothetical protein
MRKPPGRNNRRAGRSGEHRELATLPVGVCKTEQQATLTRKYSAENVDSQHSS